MLPKFDVSTISGYKLLRHDFPAVGKIFVVSVLGVLLRSAAVAFEMHMFSIGAPPCFIAVYVLWYVQSHTVAIIPVYLIELTVGDQSRGSIDVPRTDSNSTNGNATSSNGVVLPAREASSERHELEENRGQKVSSNTRTSTGLPPLLTFLCCTLYAGISSSRIAFAVFSIDTVE